MEIITRNLMSIPVKILIVDDEPNIRLTARLALEAQGFGVEEAGDGKAALARLRLGAVDLIVLDLWMPVLDGLETLRQLRDADDKTPVVIVTAHGRISDTVAAMKLGASDFLQKPMTPAALRRVVSEVIERHSVAQPEAVLQESAQDSEMNLFTEKLNRAREALKRLEFEEAEFFLGQAQTLAPRSVEAARLSNALRESRREHEGPYRIMRELFPVGRARRRGK
jgi:DNA-binding response OmpR family regulator